MPGPAADVSAGIAIGHCNSPLQKLVCAAQAAEKRAKREAQKDGYGRSAFAVSLSKRSGEILEWGAKWASGAIELYDEFVKLSSGDRPPLSNRFGYALSEVLTPYRPSSVSSPAIQNAPEFMDKVDEVIELELCRVIERQGKGLGKEDRQSLKDKCSVYLNALKKDERPLLADFPMLFQVANFIHRGERE